MRAVTVLSIPPLIATKTFPFRLIKKASCKYTKTATMMRFSDYPGFAKRWFFYKLTTSMSFVRTICLRLLILLVFIQTNYFSFSQRSSYPLKEWVKNLSAKSAPVLSGAFQISNKLKDQD